MKCEEKIYRAYAAKWPQDPVCPCLKHTLRVYFCGLPTMETLPGGLLCATCDNPILESDGCGGAECLDGAVCFDCSRSFVRQRIGSSSILCAKQHKLAAFCSSKPGRSACDRCNANVTHKDGYLRCKDCNYDVCTSCAVGGSGYPPKPQLLGPIIQQ